MEIIIRSRENGWETQRRLELPEDEGLVKSILRSVKKRTSPPAQAGTGYGSVCSRYALRRASLNCSASAHNITCRIPSFFS